MQQRYDMFLERKASVEAQMEELKKTMEVIDHKCFYYKTALDSGTEDVHKKITLRVHLLIKNGPSNYSKGGADWSAPPFLIWTLFCQQLLRKIHIKKMNNGSQTKCGH